MCISGKESDSFTGNSELTAEIVAITGLYFAVRKNNLMKSFHRLIGRRMDTGLEVVQSVEEINQLSTLKER